MNRQTSQEFVVSDGRGERHFDTEADAWNCAMIYLKIHGGIITIDHLIHDRETAVELGVEDEYDKDPDASVFCRVELRATLIGRIS